MLYIILTMIIASIAISFLNELLVWSFHGKIIDSKIIEEALRYHIPKGVRFNSIDNNMLHLGNFPYDYMPYISTHSSLFSEYHISNVGRVYKFSEAHKIIKQLYSVAKGEELPNLTLKEKLKIRN